MRSILPLLITIMSLMLACSVLAQDDAESTPEADAPVVEIVMDDDDGDLQLENAAIIQTQDVFGQVVQQLRGYLMNYGTQGYRDVVVYADLLNDDGDIIGEGFGVPVNACGTGLLDYVLPPEQRQSVLLALETFEADAVIDRIEIFPEGTPVDFAAEPVPQIDGIRRITDQEVVNVEWIDGQNLRYAIGCDGDVFTLWDWYDLTVKDAQPESSIHPAAELVTPDLLEALELTEPGIYERSYLTLAPTGSRFVYQTDINSIYTAESDGMFRRLIYDSLGPVSLHGFIWLPEGRFLAYYYGAIGDEVRYFTATSAGQRISGWVYDSTPSITVPGPTPDGQRVIISATIDDLTGYYIEHTVYRTREFLFEAEPPGNNWPAPIFDITPEREAFLYFARPIEGIPTFQCLNRQTGNLNDLTPLPLRLDDDSRAWMWLSPDRETLALAANGINGGLWLIDLNVVAACV